MLPSSLSCCPGVSLLHSTLDVWRFRFRRALTILCTRGRQLLDLVTFPTETPECGQSRFGRRALQLASNLTSLCSGRRALIRRAFSFS